MAQDWDAEPLPDIANDPAGLYHWRRDIDRQLRALRRATARQKREDHCEACCAKAFYPTWEAVEDWRDLAKLRLLASRPALPSSGPPPPGAPGGA